jgi:Zn-dependent peptidase ImmA (M78 family)/DNA-binding XRE family transcriptional regulator
MALQRANVESDILVWARETRGFTAAQAAEAIGVKPARIEQWESGKQKPTVGQLRKLAQVYKRSIGLFFLPERPDSEEIESIRDFRRMTDPDAEDLSPALRLEIRLAQERRIEAIELAAELGESLPTFGLTGALDDDPSRIASEIRDALKVKPRDQFGWSDGYEAFNSWRAAVEPLGVLVFQTGGKPAYKVSPQEIRGFSLSEDPLPVIVVNSGDAITARCFTLMHELAHIVLRAGGLCDLHDSGIEAYCNRVAAAVLVPADALAGVLNAEQYAPVNNAWREEELRRLANRFKVSWEAMLLRLLAIGRTTQEFYDQWRKSHTAPESAVGFLLPHVRAVMRNGRLLPRLAFDAHSQGYLTLNDLSTVLGENVQHVDQIARHVFDPRYLR